MHRRRGKGTARYLLYKAFSLLNPVYQWVKEIAEELRRQATEYLVGPIKIRMVYQLMYGTSALENYLLWLILNHCPKCPVSVN
jgi:hypothetical protein